MSEKIIRSNDVAKKELTIKHRGAKTTSDHIPYFILHNILSMFLFFVVSFALGLFEQQTQVISDIFSDYYLPYFGTVLFLMLLFGIVSRFIVFFFILKPIYKHVLKKSLREFSRLNEGINKISTGYFISGIINAFFFTVGALYIIQISILGSNTWWALIYAYIIMKFVTFVIMKIGRYIFVHALTGVKL